MALNEKKRLRLRIYRLRSRPVSRSTRSMDRMRKILFEGFISTLEKNEQKHYDTLGQILEGKVPECDCNDCEGKEYEPEATYDVMSKSEDKESDAF